MPAGPPAAVSQSQATDSAAGGAPLPQQSELQDIFSSFCCAPPELAKEIAETLRMEIGCKTAIDYHIYFNGLNAPADRGSREADRYIQHVSQRKESWRNNGPILICFNRANIVCTSIFNKSEATAAPVVKAPENDNEVAPLDPDVNMSLKQNWTNLYRHGLHQSHELPLHFLRRMYNRLKSRCGEAEFVKGVYTMASQGTPVLSGGFRKGRQPLNQYFHVVAKDLDDALGDDQTFHVNRSPWLFLIAREKHASQSLPRRLLLRPGSRSTET